MKSCRCATCNVSSARYAWGFALLARDGWAVSPDSQLTSFQEGAWLCPKCSAGERRDQPSFVKPVAAAAPRAGRPRGKLRILLVDDEDMVRRCTARTLADFEVYPVTSAAEALAVLAKDSDFDVVLSDVMMPRMSGPELYARCHELYPQLAQRFVFASGDPELARVQLQEVVDRLGADSAPTLLSKPGPREGLLLALFAAAAPSSASSGMWAVTDGEEYRVTQYRG